MRFLTLMRFQGSEVILKGIVSVFLIFFITGTISSQVNFTGKVIGKNDEDPVSYATIGVKGKNVGVVADVKGRFRTFFPRFIKNSDTVVISSIGYYTLELPVKQALEIQEFKLEELPKELPTVKVYSFYNKRWLSTAAQNEISFFRGWYSHKTGGEIGNIIEVPHKFYKIDKIYFKVDNNFDTCLVRLHIRKVVNSWPADELLTEDFILPVMRLSINDKACEFNLSEHNIILSESHVYVGLEVIECRSHTTQPTSISFVGTRTGEYVYKPFANSYWEKQNDFTIYFELGLQF
jgi:hypothetical protein